MNAGATSERVYGALKRKLMSGELPPGARLEPAVIAKELVSSVTPVRDALNRLTGERLVETGPSEGFHLPNVTEPALRDRYVWNAHLIRLISRSWPRDIPSAKAWNLPPDPAQAVRALFNLFAARSGNFEFALQVEATSDRLAAARVAESRVFVDIEQELRAMAALFDDGSPRELTRYVTAYHRRRFQAVPNIVRALYRS